MLCYLLIISLFLGFNHTKPKSIIIIIYFIYFLT